MVKKTYISVIIPVYHDWARLSLCLDALEKQTITLEDFEIIVVNNDPQEPPPEDLYLPDNAIVLTEAKPGSYAARNKAVRSARGDVIAFTDSDCQPRSDWLDSAISCLAQNEDLDRVGGKIELMIASGKPLSMIQIYEKAFAFRQQEYTEEQGMAATANMITRKAVFDKVGLFDESLMSGGDAEWGIRANGFGCKIVYCDSCVVGHPPRSSFAAVVQKARREVGGKFLLRKDALLVRTWSNVLLGFFPPVHSIKKVLFDKDFTLIEKIISISLRYLLRVIVHCELVLLLLSLKKVERL